MLGHFSSVREARRYLASGTITEFSGETRPWTEAGFRVEVEDEDGEWKPAKQQTVTSKDRHTP